jgi:SnoaL-like protein
MQLFTGIVMNILETDDWALWYALNRLISDYWAEVDHNGGRRAHEFYLPDAIYNVGTNCFEGHKNIQAFYERRRERGTTTTRHIVSNVRIFRDDDARCTRMVGVMSLYRAEGRPPVEEVRPLAMVADFEAKCVMADDQQWRFQSHELRPIFIGMTRPFSVAIDSGRLRPHGA